MAGRFARSGTERTRNNNNDGGFQMKANNRYQWMLIGVLSLHFGVVFFDRNAFAILTPSIAPELGLTNTHIGLIGGAFSLAWAWAGLAMGSISDRFGHRKAILIVATIVF